MAGIFDYLKWRGDLSFCAVALSDADRLIFSELSYIDLGAGEPELMPELCRKALKKQEIIKNSGSRQTLLHHKQDEKLLDILSKTPRYADVKIGFCESKTNKKREEQFGAMTVFLPDSSLLIVFRGTDWSLVGWKEDFNMAYSDDVPARKSALDYLVRVASVHDGKLHLTGHSKGGNLAIYAAIYAPAEISKRILDVTSLDGPGFSESLISSSEYAAMQDRIQTFMPSASIVGTLFSHTGKFAIIKSRGRGVMQHVLYNWEIMGGGFVTSAVRDGTSQLIETTLNDWLAGIPVDDRRKFIDTVWSVIAELGIDELGELLDGKNARAIIKNYHSLDEEARTLISDILTKLRESAKTSLADLISQAKKK